MKTRDSTSTLREKITKPRGKFQKMALFCRLFEYLPAKITKKCNCYSAP